VNELAADLGRVTAAVQKVLRGLSDEDIAALLTKLYATPPDVVKTLNAALNKALDDPAVRAKLKSLGSEVRETTPAELGDFMRVEEKKLKGLHDQGVLKGG